MGSEEGPSCKRDWYIITRSDSVQNHFNSRSIVGAATLLTSSAVTRGKRPKNWPVCKDAGRAAPCVSGVRLVRTQTPETDPLQTANRSWDKRFSVGRKLQFRDMMHTALCLDIMLWSPVDKKNILVGNYSPIGREMPRKLAVPHIVVLQRLPSSNMRIYASSKQWQKGQEAEREPMGWIKSRLLEGSWKWRANGQRFGLHRWPKTGGCYDWASKQVMNVVCGHLLLTKDYSYLIW